MDREGLQWVPANAIRPYDSRHAEGLTRTLLSPLEQLLLGQNADTIDNICFCWTPDVLMKIRRLSSATFYAVEAYFCRQWNINIHLRRWFSHVPEFLRQLRVCDGLVSGSEALTFFDRCRFLGHDLDIYLPVHGVLPMGCFLKTCGYVFQPSSTSHLLFDAAAVLFSSKRALRGRESGGLGGKRGSCKHRESEHDPGYGFSTFNFVRPIPSGYPPTHGSHVQLIGVTCDPMEFIINNFHSTGVMNMLLPTHAISLFPNTTFNKEKMYSCRDLSRYPGWNTPWIEKYRKRGFEVFLSKDAPPRSPELHMWKRKVGDALTWVIPYERRGLNEKEPTLHPYSRYAFEILDVTLGVAPPGAAFRVGPRSVYSSTAWVAASNRAKLGYTFQSMELSAAFSGFYHPGTAAGSDGELSDSNASTDETGETVLVDVE